MKPCFSSFSISSIGLEVTLVLFLSIPRTSLAQNDWLAFNQNGVSVVMRSVEIKQGIEKHVGGNYNVYAYNVTATVTNNSGNRIKLPDGFSLSIDRADCMSSAFPSDLGVSPSCLGTAALSAGILGINESASTTGCFISRCKPFFPGMYKFSYILLNDPRPAGSPSQSAGPPSPNSGGNFTKKPASQPKGIPYGNDTKCLNCENESRISLPPPSKAKETPYGNDFKCLNCEKEGNPVLPPPNQTRASTQKSQIESGDDDDDISKIDSSDPEAVLRWTTRQAEKAIKELEDLSRSTKCPATAAAYRKLASYSRCLLAGGNCGQPPPDDIPDCPEDNN